MNESQNNSQTILDVAATTTFLTALLYATGWSYAYRWFDHFNLGLIGLGIPKEYFFMYAFWSLRDLWWLLAGAFVLIVGIGSLLHKKFPLSLKRWTWRTAPLWVLISFVGAYELGEYSATTDYRDHQATGFGRFPEARIWLKLNQTHDEKLIAMSASLASHDYRVLLETNAGFYLIKSRTHTSLPVVFVPTANIHAVRVLPINPGLPD